MRIDYAPFTRSRISFTVIVGFILFSLATPSVAADPELVKITVHVQDVASPTSRVSIGIITSFQGSLVDATILSVHVWRPDFTPPPTILAAPTRFVTGHFNTTWVVPEDAELGLYFVHVLASSNGTRNEESVRIRITAGDPDHLDDTLHQIFVKLDGLEGSLLDFLPEAGELLNSISSDLASLKTSLSSVSSELAAARSDLSSLSTAVSGVSGKADTLGNDIASLGDAVAGVKSDVSVGVGSLTTLVYVAIALSVITLILEVVVLARKRQ